MRATARVLALFVVLLAGLAAAAQAQEAAQLYVREKLRIPMPEAQPGGLEAWLIRPATPGRYPLVLINHGSPRVATDRAGMTPYVYLPQMMEFARRGWAVVAVMRRGFGESGGGFAENSGTCSEPNYAISGQTAAVDLRAAIRYLATRADIDGSRVVSVGQSAGGFATVALTADPPPGLVAAISFAGGRGSPRDGEICVADRLVAAFAKFGKTSRIPMLWIYAENDQFFGPEIAQRLHQAFTAGGGVAEFIRHPAFGRDGHSLFGGGIALWTPYVDAFLKAQKLVLRETLLPSPLPKIAPPAGLGDSGRKGFAEYLAAGPHKAFAISAKGAYGWKSGRRTPEDAKKGALDNCHKHDTDCRVVFVDEASVGPP